MKPLPAAPTQIDLSPLSLRAAVRPESIDAEARTAEVIFSTGAPVSRFDWGSGQRYTETLSLKASDVRLDRLNDGGPFLNAHNAYDLRDVLGVVVKDSARVSGGKALATIRFSKRDDVEPIWRDVQDGILRNLSVGYRVHKYEQTEAADGAPAIRHAVDWEPYEISAVPMPADNGAKVRADTTTPTNPCQLVTRATKETPAMDDATPSPQILDPMVPLPIPAAVRATDVVVPNDVDRGADEERERITGIINACEAARLPMSEARRLIEGKVSLVKAQAEVFESLRTRAHDAVGPKEGPSGVRFVGADPLENVWRGISNALLHKAAPQYFKLDDIGRPYRSRSLLAAAELCLHHRGVPTHDLARDTLAGMALGLTQVRGGVYSGVADFANILVDASNKILRAAYDEAPQTFEPISRRIPIPDFKTVNVTQFGAAPALLEVREDGEFTSGVIGDAKETFALTTYGRIFAISRKSLVNDDLDAFSSVPVKFGRAARNKESDLIWAQITSNPTMGDSVALFSTTTHVNLAGSSAAIDVSTLAAGFAAMRIQKDLDAATPLNLAPAYLIVPVAKEAIARQYTTTITPAVGSNVNPFSGMLQVIAEPRLDANSATAWYLAANKAQTDIVLYGFLDGQDGPSVESQVGWKVDGLEIKCRHDVAAKVVEWRALYKNGGA